MHVDRTGPGGDAVRVGGWEEDWRQRGPYRRGAGKAGARGVAGAQPKGRRVSCGWRTKRLAEWREIKASLVVLILNQRATGTIGSKHTQKNPLG